MAGKFTIQRVTGEGEQIMAEVNIPESQIAQGPAAVHRYVSTFYGALDLRLVESSHRVLDAMQLERQVPAELRGHVALLVRQVLDILYGRANPAATVNKDAIMADRDAQAKEKERLAKEGVDADNPVNEKSSNVIQGPWANKEPGDGNGEGA